MSTTRRIGGAGATALLMAVALLPAVYVTPSAAGSGRVIDGSSFERSLRGWSPTGRSTRLDRVDRGHGKKSASARLRPPRGRTATVGMTDAPALIRSSKARARYVARVWVKANRDALRSGPVRVRLSLGEVTQKGHGVTGWRLSRLHNTRWQQVSVPFTSRHDGRRLDLTVRAIDLRPGGAVLVDDVRIMRSPRPSASNRRLAGTRFGTFVDQGRLEFRRALRLSDRRFTRMEAVRFFEPVIRDGWSGKLGEVKRPMSVSFRAPVGQVLSGEHDAMLRTWFRNAPGGFPIWWTYWHEPEDDIAAGQMTARRYRLAWQHINAIARQVAGNNLHPTLILMAWTARSGSGRSVSDYYPGDFIDVVAWDGYNPPGATGYAAPKAIFGSAAAKTKRLGKRFAIGELGSVLVPGDEGSRRARWLVDAARFASARNAPFVTYWDAKIPNENYQLRDVPSRLAWRSVVKD